MGSAHLCRRDHTRRFTSDGGSLAVDVFDSGPEPESNGPFFSWENKRPAEELRELEAACLTVPSHEGETGRRASFEEIETLFAAGEAGLPPSRGREAQRRLNAACSLAVHRTAMQTMLNPEARYAEVMGHLALGDRTMAEIEADGRTVDSLYIEQVYEPMKREAARLRRMIQRRQERERDPLSHRALPRPALRRRPCSEARPRQRRTSRRPAGTRAGPGGDDPHPGGDEPPRARSSHLCPLSYGARA